MNKYKISSALIFVLAVNMQLTAQIPRTIYEKTHHSLSFQPVYMPINFSHSNQTNVSSAATGAQFRYSIHFPLTPLYSIGLGFYIGHHIYKFDQPNDPLGYLDQTDIRGAIGASNGSIKNHFAFHSIGFPIYFSGVFPLSNNLLIVVNMGANLNGIEHDEIWHSNPTPTLDKSVVQTDSSLLVVAHIDHFLNNSLQVGFLIELGPEYTFRNGNIFSIFLSTNINFITHKKVRFELYPELETYASTSFMETSGSYFGISINYVFVKFLKRR